MKKIWFFSLIFMLFAGCVQPTIDVPNKETPVETPAPETPEPETTAPYFVKNSKWELVDISTLPARSVAPSLDQALEIVKMYNAENNDNQLFLDTVDVPIEKAPTVNVYIVNEGDYVLLAEYIGLDRSDFASRRTDFDIDARVYGGLLFIDKVPPKPAPIIDPRTDHEKYHLQMVNKYNQIVVYNGYRYEESCELTYAGFIGSPDGDGPARGWATVDDYFNARVRGYELEIHNVGTQADSPWRVVSGSIHIEP